MKLIVKLLGGFLALITLAAIAIPLLISAETIKSELQKQVKKATGRELSIKGKASLSVFPNIAVTVEDATLGNPPGFASPYLVHIAKLETGAALMPLLSKQLHITGVTLDGATIYLEENKSGDKNWEFAKATTKPASATTESASKQTSASESPLKEFAIGTVTIRGSTVHYSKPGSAPVKLEGITLTLAGADGKSPLALKVEAAYRSEKIALDLSVKSIKPFLEGTLVPTAFALKAPFTNISFKGEAGAKAAQYGLDGKLETNIADVAKLQSWATGKPAKPVFPRSVKLNSNVKASASANTVQLSDLTTTLDTLSATGNVKITHGGTVPALSGALTIPQLDVAALTGGSAKAEAAAGAQPKAANTSAPSEGWSGAPIDASGLKAVNADLTLSVGQLKSGAFTASDIKADLALSGGKLAMKLANAGLYGGNAQGVVKLDGSGQGVGVGLDVALARIDIEALMTALTGASRLEGAANLTMKVNGSGASQRALVSSLNGAGTAKISDGAVKGINIASFLRDAKKGFILGESTTESTDFTELTASYTIAQGMISNNDLFMKSPVLRLTGSGTVNVPGRSINYRAMPSIVGTLKGQGGKDKLSAGGLDIPLIITGPWSAVSVTPDLSGILQNALKDPAALQQNIKDIKDNIGKFNSPKDIGAALFGDKKKAPTPEASPPTDSAPAPTSSASGVSAPKRSAAETATDALLKGVLGQ